MVEGSEQQAVKQGSTSSCAGMSDRVVGNGLNRLPERLVYMRRASLSIGRKIFGLNRDPSGTFLC